MLSILSTRLPYALSAELASSTQFTKLSVLKHRGNLKCRKEEGLRRERVILILNKKHYVQISINALLFKNF